MKKKIIKKPRQRPKGRPSKYKVEYCDKLIEHMKQGGSFDTFGAVIGINARSTLYEWVKEYPDFSDAKSLAEMYAAKWFEDLGRAGMTGSLTRIKEKIYDKEGNLIKEIREAATFGSTAWIFSMKNRFNWKDKQEFSGDQENPLIFSVTDIVKQSLKDAEKLKNEK